MKDSYFGVSLTRSQRTAIADLFPQMARRLKLNAEGQQKIAFTVSELQSILWCAGEAVPTTDQFKVTLPGIEPPIWRRIQIRDCSVDKLHEHIQTAMGWTNSHLHRFEILGIVYGDPELVCENPDCFVRVNSLKTKVSKIVPRSGARFQFSYEYDFGDRWRHDVLFEGCLAKDEGVRYPLCLEGERACPPEDVGGVSGYEKFLEAIADPEHEEHLEWKEWAGWNFDPERF